MDTNDNDVQDAGDMGIQGVVVTLVETGATTTTDSNGDYSFTGLAPGTYSVEFTDPAGVLAGKQLVAQDDPNGNGNDTNDSDASGDTSLSSISGINVTSGNDTPNNDAGVEDIPAVPGSLSGRYFMDSNDNDQDDGEMGIAGVAVMLLDAAGNATGATAVTDGNGDYSFTGLAAGTYGVKFTDPSGVLAGKQLVTADQGNDATDSDAIGDTTQSIIVGIDVTEGNDTPNNDAGAEDVPVVPTTGDIKGTYFCDNNSNDVQDRRDTPVPDATVELRDASGAVVRTTTTDTGHRRRHQGCADRQGVYLW